MKIAPFLWFFLILWVFKKLLRFVLKNIHDFAWKNFCVFLFWNLPRHKFLRIKIKNAKNAKISALKVIKNAHIVIFLLRWKKHLYTLNSHHSMVIHLCMLLYVTIITKLQKCYAKKVLKSIKLIRYVYTIESDFCYKVRSSLGLVFFA